MPVVAVFSQVPPCTCSGQILGYLVITQCLKRRSFVFQDEFELPYDEEWEIDESQLSIKEELLGEGAFGLVMKAEAYDLPGYPKCHTVAVKMLRSK